MIAKRLPHFRNTSALLEFIVVFHCLKKAHSRSLSAPSRSLNNPTKSFAIACFYAKNGLNMRVSICEEIALEKNTTLQSCRESVHIND